MINEHIRIGFIGFGNMGRGICDGLLAADAVDPAKISACAAHWEKLLDNTEKRGINAAMTAEEVAENADLIIVAVKPYLVKEVLEPIKDLLMGKAVISIAAGLHFDFFDSFLIDGTNMLCTVPNTPVSVRQGVFICENKNSLTAEQKNAFVKIFSSIAVVEFVDSHVMNIAGTISGCGPAFAALFIEALADAGVKYGLNREAAYRIVSKMMEGTAVMQLASGDHPGVMKDAVCSPGGTTIRGVAALEENGFRNALIKAIDAIEG